MSFIDKNHDDEALREKTSYSINIPKHKSYRLPDTGLNLYSFHKTLKKSQDYLLQLPFKTAVKTF